MNIEKVKNRSVIFTYQPDSWALNLHLITGRRFDYLIDTGLGCESVKPVQDYLKNSSRQLIVINTHYHWDHIWGNGEFKSQLIISHRLCRDLISEKWDEMLERNKKYICGSAEFCLPGVVFEKELYFPEDHIRLIHTPGHTADSVSVIDEEDGIMNAGDNVGDSIDEIVPSLYTDTETYIETLKYYLSLNFDTVISGHNKVLGKEVFDTIMNKVLEK